jgi:hypothetical protein
MPSRVTVVSNVFMVRSTVAMAGSLLLVRYPGGYQD